MTTTLRPSPVTTRLFDYDPKTRTFSAEASDLRVGFGRVWADSCDEGLTMVSATTGREVVFVVQDEVRDREGDTLYWTLRSVDGQYTATVFND
jgi:hypothetical protein